MARGNFLQADKEDSIKNSKEADQQAFLIKL